MEEMNRRDFVIAAVGGLGLLSADCAPAQHRMHVRHNVYCLNPQGREIRAYAKAVTAMQARPSNDPTSWSAQAAIHGTLTPTPGMIVNQCEHGTRFFFSWHRMFLYYFERIVRTASGDPAFALPYWGYSPTGNRDLPLAFRTPASSTNPLYVANRRTAINGGTPITPSVVDAGTALLQLVFNPFSFTLEGTPHGAVHVTVGGWMGSVPTAAQDPIFWLHHANIDRLWDVWIASGGGRADPSDAPWLTRSYDFYDETGTRVTLTGSQVLDDARQLGYRYAPSVCRGGDEQDDQDEHGNDEQSRRTLTQLPPEAETLALEDSLRRRPPRGQAMISGQAQGPISLRATPAVAQLPISAEARRLLATFLKDPAAGSGFVLALEDVRAEAPVDVFYELYVDLPVGSKDTVYTSPYYLGNLDFFGAVEGPIQRQYNMVPIFRRLQALRAWSEDTVRLTFVPRAFVEGEDPARLLGKRTQGRVGRAVLRIE
jgi:hypothetical protein